MLPGNRTRYKSSYQPVRTNAPPGRSYHGFGAAVDVDVRLDGKCLSQLPKHRDVWGRIEAIAQRHGLEWGGNFKPNYDPVHFQYTGGTSIDTMIQRYQGRAGCVHGHGLTMEGSMGQSFAPMIRNVQLGAGIICISYACSPKHADAPVAVDTEVHAAQDASAAPESSGGEILEPAPVVESTGPRAPCTPFRGATSLPRSFRVSLSGNERINVAPGSITGLPNPARLDDLDPWCKDWNDKDAARPMESYSLTFEGDVTLTEFAATTTVFTSRGFVHPIVSVNGVDIDFYSGYVPPEASRPVDKSLATLNLVIDGKELYVTSILMLDQWKHHTIEDRRFDLAALGEGCADSLGAHLRHVCDHPRRPCDRVLLTGLRTAPIAPFLEAVALLRQLLPDRVPGVTAQSTVKAGIAAKYRDTGANDFLRLEGIIEPIQDSMHP